MIARLTTAAVLGLALTATQGAAQTVAEQMQKAIYTQETTGDLDAAIQMYRQILNSSPADRKYAAMAQFRLAQALLQKGDLPDAAIQFQALANYPEYKDVIASMAGRTGGRTRGSVISRGTYTITAPGQGGHYSHKATGIELTVPPGWNLTDGESSDNGDMAMLSGPNGRDGVAVWMISEEHPATELAALLRHDLENKSSMRPQGWKVRPESVQLFGGGDHQSLKAIADFTANGTKFVEYLVWARSTRSKGLFFGTATADSESSLADNVSRIVATAVIP
jgi:tetratricopeptide (TPR) repeat protein